MRTGFRVALATALMLAGAETIVALGSSQAPEGKDWVIPKDASQERNPVAATPDTLKAGRAIFESRCQACHGKDGRGRPMDNDPSSMSGNLTDPLRASFNPDGVMFYKVWNGREKPRMPAFKTGLTRDEVWTVITYAKSLRK